MVKPVIKMCKSSVNFGVVRGEFLMYGDLKQDHHTNSAGMKAGNNIRTSAIVRVETLNTIYELV